MRRHDVKQAERMLSTGPILNGGGSSLTGGLIAPSVEKSRGMELVELEHCCNVE
jgi:hypothetical protein